MATTVLFKFNSMKLINVVQKMEYKNEFKLSEVAEALRYFGEGHVRGKIVITSDLLVITI
jgi:hypothetical protein